MIKILQKLGFIKNKQNRVFDFKPNPPPTEFQAFILRALKEMTVRELAELAQTSLPTVQRWASGQTAPVKSFEKHIINHCTPEVMRREDELYERLFGRKKHT